MRNSDGFVDLLIIAILAISSLSINQAAAASPVDIEKSVSSGLVWLAGNQNSDGSFGSSYKVAYTAFAVLTMENRALELGYGSPFDSNYIYSGNVKKGLDFIFKNAILEGDNSLYFPGYPIYSTSIAMAAIAESTTPDRTVGIIQSPVDGWDYKKIELYAQGYLLKAQLSSGGWSYELGESPADNSNSGYAVVGLAYAQEKFGINIPPAVKDGINRWIGYIQCPNDGGSGYLQPCDWDNILKTGNLLYQMSVVGDTSATPRAQNAIQFIENHWNDANQDPGWIANGVPLYQAAFCMMRGFEAMQIKNITVLGSDVNWFDKMSTAIVNNQIVVDGSWPSDTWGDKILTTEWALLSLEKSVAQPSNQNKACYDIAPPVPGSWTSYGKVIGFTNSNDRPFVVADRDSNRHVFVTDQNGQLWDNKNGNWYSLGGRILGSPSLLPDAYGKFHVFVRGTDNRLYENYLDPITMSSSWQGLGGGITSSPCAVITQLPPKITYGAIFVRGSDGGLWARDLNFGSGGSYGGGWNNLGGGMVGTPCAVTSFSGPGSSYLYTFVRGRTDNHLWVKKVNSSTGSSLIDNGWTNLGGSISGSPKAIPESGIPYIVAFVTDSSPNRGLWANELNLQTMTGAWYSKGGVISDGSDPSLTLSNGPAEGNIHTIVRSKNKNESWDCVNTVGNIAASPQWYDLGGNCKSDPCVTLFDGYLRAYGQGSDNALWTYRSESRWV